MSNQSRVIALGFFDGVHLGHGALLRRAAEEACGEDRPRDIAVTLYPDSGTQRVVEIVFDWPENVENNA